MDLTECEDPADARGRLGRFIDEVCNRKRIHSASGHLAPAEFEERWIRMQRVEAPIPP